jgi:hypothetical protein
MCALFAASTVYAQNTQPGFRFSAIQHKVTLGYNLGATAPLSMPNTIRKINSFSPLFTPVLGYEAQYDLSPKWTVGTGLKIESKGMKVVDSVQYFHTLIKVQNDDGGEDGIFEGDFTGMNKTRAKNSYLTLPVYTEYHIEKWSLRAGMYVSYLLSAQFDGEVYDGYIRKGNSLGEKVLIKRATFDFADQVKKWDWGFNIGASRKLGSQWEVSAIAQLGMAPIFDQEFKGVGYNLHQLFVTVSAGYRFDSADLF